MTEVVLISISIYLAIGSFITGVCSKNGSIQFALLTYVMLLWPFIGIALIGALIRSIHEHFAPKG